MESDKKRSILPNVEPTLGKMFHDNEYNTAIFGKAQPLRFLEQNNDATQQEKLDRLEKLKDFKKKHHGFNGVRSYEMENNFF